MYLHSTLIKYKDILTLANIMKKDVYLHSTLIKYKGQM